MASATMGGENIIWSSIPVGLSEVTSVFWSIRRRTIIWYIVIDELNPAS
jgi:hypothetical protein